MNVSKKGLSSVVATMLIIVLTVLGISILSVTLIPFTKNKLEKSTECIDYKNYFSFVEVFEFEDKEFRYNCFYDPSIDNKMYYGLSVSAESESSVKKSRAKIVGLNINFVEKLGESFSKEIMEGVSDGKVKVAIDNIGDDPNQITIPKPGEIRTYFIESVRGVKYDEARVFPELESESICPESDVIDIIECNNDVVLKIKQSFGLS